MARRVVVLVADSLASIQISFVVFCSPIFCAFATTPPFSHEQRNRQALQVICGPIQSIPTVLAQNFFCNQNPVKSFLRLAVDLPYRSSLRPESTNSVNSLNLYYVKSSIFRGICKVEKS